VQQHAYLEAVERLRTAAETGEPCVPVRDVIAPWDIATAYAVQSSLIQARVVAGDHRIGRKIGLTSPAVQAQLGVDQPDFGVLLDSMRVPDAGEVPARVLLQPKVEAEVAFTLQADLDGPLDAATVRAAVATAHAAIEIVDSRIAGWDISIVDTVADNASSGLFVLGDRALPLEEIEPRDVSMQLTLNGAPASSGTGVACLGDPLLALAWLARQAQQFADPLRAGDVVLSGALGPMVAVAPGDEVHAEITQLGAVSVRFAKDQG
jgi:2-keto-4-pentenoate hydratase